MKDNNGLLEHEEYNNKQNRLLISWLIKGSQVFLFSCVFFLFFVQRGYAQVIPPANSSLLYEDSQEFRTENGAEIKTFDEITYTISSTGLINRYKFYVSIDGITRDESIVTKKTNRPPNGVINKPRGNITISTGDSVDFTGTGTDQDKNTPLTFLWNFGGSGIANSTVEDPGLKQFNTAGIFTVSLTVTDALGLADPTPATRIITVQSANQPPDGVIDTPTGNVTISVGGTVNFTGTGTDPNTPLTFLWNFGGSGIANATVEDPGLKQFNTAGTFTVSFTVTDALGLADPTPATRVITVQSGASVIPHTNWSLVSVDSQELAGENGAGVNAFDGNVTTRWHTKWLNGADPLPHEIQINLGGVYDVNGFRYLPNQINGRIAQWEFYVSTSTANWGTPVATGTFANDATEKEVLFTQKAGQYVRLRALSEVNGNPWTHAAEINVLGVISGNQPPNGVIDTPTGNVTINVGGTVNFTGTGTDPNTPLTFLWTFGGSGIANATVEDPGLKQFNTAGTFTVSFTVTDALGLADPTPATRIITVQSANQPPNGVIDTPTGNVTINVGESVNFTGTGTDPNTPLTFLWTFGGSGIANATVEDPGLKQFNTAGTFTVNFTVTDALGLADPTPATRIITVQSVNQPPNGVIDTPTGNLTVDVGESVNFTGTGTDPNTPLTFLWTFGGSGIANATVEDPGLKQFNTVGTFTVSFTVTDALGLADPTPATRIIAVQSGALPNWKGVTSSPFNLVTPTVVTNPVLKASDITGVSARFVADTFLYYESNTWYMFTEIYNNSNNQGDLTVATSSDGLHWAYQQIVLNETWHLSYPYVFKFNGTYYMIPETYQLNEIRVYKATNFPTTWSYVATLVSGRDFVDPSIFRYNNTWWMFVSDTTNSNCYLYYSNSLTSGWIEHPLSPIVVGNASKARPGGRAFVYNNNLIMRTVQKCDVVYGEKVRVFQVDTLTTTQYAEHEIPESPILSNSGSGWNATGMHQFDPWWTGNHWNCAVDGKTGTVSVWSAGIYLSPHPSSPNGVIDSPAGNVTINKGQSVNFAGTGTDVGANTPLTFLWNFGGSGVANSSLEDPGLKQFNTSGTFTVSFTVTDTLGIYDPTPGVRTISVQSTSTVIPKTNWSLRFVDSQELVGENGAAVNAFDGNTSTKWHTKWFGGSDPIPHEIQINLGAMYNVSGFRYLPRQDGGVNGRIKDWEFYVSTDGTNWGSAVATGTFVNDATEKEVFFTLKAGQYVRLKALSEVNNNPWTSMAEITVLQN
jgi:hypothetical protein